MTCSHASDKGGAAAISTRISWSGATLVNALRDPSAGPIDCPILVISAFNGVGGAFQIYDVLGVYALWPRSALKYNVTPTGSSFTAWPDVEEMHDITELTLDDVKRCWT